MREDFKHKSLMWGRIQLQFDLWTGIGIALILNLGKCCIGLCNLPKKNRKNLTQDFFVQSMMGVVMVLLMCVSFWGSRVYLGSPRQLR